MLKELQDNNPNYIHDHKLRDEWHEIVQSVMGGSNNKERERNTKNISTSILDFQTSIFSNSKKKKLIKNNFDT